MPNDLGNSAESTFARARNGEPVLDELLAENLPRLRAFARAHMTPELRLRESASDLVQSVCRELLGSLAHFDFRSAAEFRAWMFKAARNKIAAKARFHHRVQRSLRREVRLESADAQLVTGYGTMSTPSFVAAREHVAMLEQALDCLQPDHREVIVLTRLAELPPAEVAATMGRSIDATRMLLGRALLKLAHALRRVGLQPPHCG